VIPPAAPAQLRSTRARAAESTFRARGPNPTNCAGPLCAGVLRRHVPEPELQPSSGFAKDGSGPPQRPRSDAEFTVVPTPEARRHLITPQHTSKLTSALAPGDGPVFRHHALSAVTFKGVTARGSAALWHWPRRRSAIRPVDGPADGRVRLRPSRHQPSAATPQRLSDRSGQHCRLAVGIRPTRVTHPGEWPKHLPRDQPAGPQVAAGFTCLGAP